MDFQEIVPGVFLGSKPSNPGDIVGSFEAVLDVRMDGDLGFIYSQNAVAYLWIPMEDGVLPGENRLDEALTWIRTQLDSGRRVLVHCDAGTSRSALICAYYLVRNEGLSADQAVAVLQSRRSRVLLHQRFVTKLRQLAGDDFRSDETALPAVPKL